MACNAVDLKQSSDQEKICVGSKTKSHKIPSNGIHKNISSKTELIDENDHQSTMITMNNFCGNQENFMCKGTSCTCSTLVSQNTTNSTLNLDSAGVGCEADELMKRSEKQIGNSKCGAAVAQETAFQNVKDTLDDAASIEKMIAGMKIETDKHKDTSPTLVKEDDIAEHIVSASKGICYARYKSELQMPAIMHLITKDLSEPYSIYTYRYFIHNWPHLCFLAIHESKYVGAIVCKLDLHKKVTRRGYIAMLAVDETVRRRKIGSTLVKMAIEAMTEDGCDEVVLETEVTNHSALKLYENLGFVRDKRLFRYYLNGVDALRLKLWLC